MKYAVVFEKTSNNFSAYVPDLPGCIATGTTREEVEHRVRQAIAFHVQGLKKEGQPIPEAESWSELVEV